MPARALAIVHRSPASSGRFAVAVVAVVACSGPRTAVVPPPGGTPDAARAAPATDAVAMDDWDAAAFLVDPTPDARAAPVVETSCPPDYPVAQSACTYVGTCAYGEGSCRCGLPPWCGGMNPGNRSNEPRSWQCTPKVRADGCPGKPPVAGSRCKTARQVCDYSCSCASGYACTRGKWVHTQGPCKP